MKHVWFTGGAWVMATTMLLAALPGCRPAERNPSTLAPPPPVSLDQVLAMLDRRPHWTQRPVVNTPRHPAEKYLAGWTIVLDPGHGGDAHLPDYKRGPTGVREAEINLRVTLLLARLLEDAGVHVLKTRAGDEDVSLERRAAIANEAVRPDGGRGADLFLSLHHNGTRNPDTNYTSVWYHGEGDWSGASLDVARYLTHRIAAALRTDVGYTSPLMSDRQLYDSGFAVLRHTRVPAVLLESSFHTNPAEEQRLTDPAYNLREAYAIYEGLCEYAYGARPTQHAMEITGRGERATVSWQLDDGLPPEWWGSDRRGPLVSTISVSWQGRRIEHSYDPDQRRVMVILPAGNGWLELHHQNIFKHHNWPRRYRVTRGGGGVPVITPDGRLTMNDDPAATQPALAR